MDGRIRNGLRKESETEDKLESELESNIYFGGYVFGPNVVIPRRERDLQFKFLCPHCPYTASCPSLDHFLYVSPDKLLK
jgi:hypothetical protein